MSRIFVSSRSFVNKNESVSVSEFLSNNTDLIDSIDKSVRIWILENSNNKLWEDSIKEGKVVYPCSLKPISSDLDVSHLAIMRQVDDDDEMLFGNTDDDVSSFVESVLKTVRKDFPKD